jgi:hypothetical protein
LILASGCLQVSVLHKNLYRILKQHCSARQLQLKADTPQCVGHSGLPRNEEVCPAISCASPAKLLKRADTVTGVSDQIRTPLTSIICDCIVIQGSPLTLPRVFNLIEVSSLQIPREAVTGTCDHGCVGEGRLSLLHRQVLGPKEKNNLP